MKLEDIPQCAPTVADLYNEFLWCAQQVEHTASEVRAYCFDHRKESFTYKQAGTLGNRWWRHGTAVINAAYELPQDNFTALLMWVFFFKRHHDFTCHMPDPYDTHDRSVERLDLIQRRMLDHPNGWRQDDALVQLVQKFFHRVARTQRRRDWSDQLALLKLTVG